MIAHKRTSDGNEQSISEHSRNVAVLCAENSGKIMFGKLGYLIGLLHDMGKYTERFGLYLRSQYDQSINTTLRGEIHHSPTGAIFTYEHWRSGNRARLVTSQIIAIVVYGHHSGLMDTISTDGSSPLLERLARDKSEICYEEAVYNYLQNVCSEAELNELFDEAVAEIENRKKLLFDFNAGLLARQLLGCLVDADRWDSACFEYGDDPFVSSPTPDWKMASAALEQRLTGLLTDTPLSKLRGEISDAALAAADNSPGIFKLTVPTGGGKTFASLRFALCHAQKNNMDRIFYAIPFNTILDQNAHDIRTALGDTIRVIEHHNNVVFDEQLRPGEIEDYKKLTERWDSDLILTSVVQFLNALFRRENTAARRLSHLSRSVIIFDEIQALPKNCTRLFEKAVNFLTELCGCSVLLCTATQPQLRLKAREIVPDTDMLFSSLCRTRLIDESPVARSSEQAASDVLNLIRKHGAVLMIVNTRAAARRMYELVRTSDIPCIYLSTDMYPAHRLRLIEEIKKRTGSESLFCVSTALIEAGINISFPCVVRSLAGLGSILQAAGRCNRNAELPDGARGEVHIWRLGEENLCGLPEIQAAQHCTEGILALGDALDPASPEGIESYFKLEREAFSNVEDYPAEAGGTDVTLVDLLGKNIREHDGEARARLRLYGAYRTAGELFHVIGSDTRAVLVAHGGGERICAALSVNPGMAEKLGLLREAQRYSVSLYPNFFSALVQGKAIWEIKSAGIYVLRKEHYSNETGVIRTANQIESCIY